VTDLRFPTSRDLDGSDAMNPDPDYSVAYLQLKTGYSEPASHAFVFTIGRGNSIQVAAVQAVANRLVGRSVDAVCEDPTAINRELLWDSQLRWLGPDKGVIHMAIGAVMNAVWDLRARRESRPLWATLACLEPDEVVALVDWTYIGDYLDPGRAREILEERRLTRDRRVRDLQLNGLAAYATTPGWLGYSDDKLTRLSAKATADGFGTIKLKVGSDLRQDRHRLALARRVVGEEVGIAVDANQRWSVPEAIETIRRFAEFNLSWVEEPTHPDDILGHARIARAVAPIPVATGEHLANPTLAKQLLQAGGAHILQIDATRVGGVHDLVAMLLLAAHAGVEVMPHAGGVGLCEAVQHFAFFNAIAIASDHRKLAIEYVEHLHEHMATPVEVTSGRYRMPTAPGGGTAFVQAALSAYKYPNGTEWKGTHSSSPKSVFAAGL